MTEPALAAAKASLRKSVANRLRDISPASLAAQSSAVTATLLRSSYYTEASRLSVYLSLPTSEINTDAIIHDALATGRSVFIPFCKPPSAPMKMLRLSSIEEFHSLSINKWGIREFDSAVGKEEALDNANSLDLVLVPGVAFDVEGNRLGHGKGYYDRYISRCIEHSTTQNHSPPTTVALALTEQILPPGSTVPTNVDDIKPQYILTPQDEIPRLNSFGG